MSDKIAALSFQGPTSCEVLKKMGLEGVETLKPFGIMHAELNGVELMVSRTGYTGYLGYELWTDPSNALSMWDSVFSVKERGLYDVRCRAPCPAFKSGATNDRDERNSPPMTPGGLIALTMSNFHTGSR